jgi:hypothetical protein
MTFNNLPIKQSNVDKTNSYFNNYYQTIPSISSSIDDAFVTYFEGITGNKETALILAGSIIVTAQQQGLDLEDILKKFKALEKTKVDGYLTMLLNLNRVPTSLLGVVNNTSTSKYVSRMIRV